MKEKALSHSIIFGSTADMSAICIGIIIGFFSILLT